MNYYINDYEYEKHDLLVEEGEKTQATEWLDRPELFFAANNTVKIGYTLSLVDGDTVVTTFYNDLILKAKDGHRLSTEEVTIFIFLLINDTILQSGIYLAEQHQGEKFSNPPATTPDDIIVFVQERLDALN